MIIATEHLVTSDVKRMNEEIKRNTKGLGNFIALEWTLVDRSFNKKVCLELKAISHLVADVKHANETNKIS